MVLYGVMMGKVIEFPTRQPIDPAVNKLKSMIKWTMFNDGHPILVAEFQIIAKHDFEGRPGKKKIENEADMMTEDLLKALRKVLK